MFRASITLEKKFSTGYKRSSTGFWTGKGWSPLEKDAAHFGSFKSAFDSAMKSSLAPKFFDLNLEIKEEAN
jgi:hypothetical protein